MAISRLIRDENLKSCGKTISYLEDIKEIWKDIKGYEGLYQVSNWGRVKSLAKNTEYIMKGYVNKKGYKSISLFKNHKYKNLLIHQLVAIAFIPNNENLTQINHKDENKTNNKIYNLEWCTQKYNNSYGSRLQRTSESQKGKEKPRCWKAVLQIDKDTNEIINEFASIKEASKFLNIYPSNISNVCRGKINSTGGYKWRFK